MRRLIWNARSFAPPFPKGRPNTIFAQLQSNLPIQPLSWTPCCAVLASLIFTCTGGSAIAARVEKDASASASQAAATSPQGPQDKGFPTPTAPNPALRELTQVAQIRNLAPQEASRGYPVRVTGVVTHQDPELSLQFVQDETAGIYLELLDPASQRLPESGHRVEITGFSSPGDYAPLIRVQSVRDLGESSPPTPKNATLRMLLTGAEDSQWVAVTGVVRSQVVRDNHTILGLSTDDGRVNVTIPEANKHPAPRRYENQTVEVHAVCATVFNERRQLQGVELHAPSWSRILIKETSSEDPTKLPLSHVNELLQFNPGQNGPRRSRIQGIVTLRQANGIVFVQDDTGGVRIQASDSAAALTARQAVEVVGLPSVSERLPFLKDAIFKSATNRWIVPPLVLRPDGALNPSFHATLVSMEGRVIGHSTRTRDETLTIQFGPLMTDAVLETAHNSAELSHVTMGSVVRLTGVYSAHLDEDGNGQSFQLLLRDAGDVLLLSQPSWWTPRRILWATTGSGVALCGAVAWIWLLRREVQGRTRELQEEIAERKSLVDKLRKLSRAVEHSPTSIVITDTAGRIEYVNPKFTRLTGYSAEEVIGQTPAILKSGSTPPEDYRRLWNVLRAGQEWQGEFHNKKKNGDLYWEYAFISPITNPDGEITHYVAVKEDITDRKRSEAELKETHQKLLDASRQAGMAEVATSVLHNVGNVLNSVNVSASLVVDQIQHSRAAGLKKMVTLLRAHEGDLAHFMTEDPKGKQVLPYLEGMADQLDQEQTGALQELELLTKNIEHIKDIVSVQQAYAKVSGVIETVSVKELIEDALRMNVGALTRHEIQVSREYQPALPSIAVEKHKVLQILVNLISNAKTACHDSGRPDKRLAISARNGGCWIRIAISDNGVGIAGENLTRIFSHGFTTRQGGHGFGLHSGALAARELGGQLLVQSEGLGRGATFTLELPVKTLKTGEA